MSARDVNWTYRSLRQVVCNISLMPSCFYPAFPTVQRTRLFKETHGIIPGEYSPLGFKMSSFLIIGGLPPRRSFPAFPGVASQVCNLKSGKLEFRCRNNLISSCDAAGRNPGRNGTIAARYSFAMQSPLTCRTLLRSSTPGLKFLADVQKAY